MDEPRTEKAVIPLKPRLRSPLPADIRVLTLIFIIACCGLVFSGWLCVARYVV